ncbi:uncharacterized protein BROUX77_003310 [Berkeleyomyces rouxiae]|uniref:uncharacterized protein n=1 Tax=Berkeleyomyces rouxiae TaxID=2035830 RepID=UPI003B8189BA
MKASIVLLSGASTVSAIWLNRICAKGFSCFDDPELTPTSTLSSQLLQPTTGPATVDSNGPEINGLTGLETSDIDVSNFEVKNHETKHPSQLAATTFAVVVVPTQTQTPEELASPGHDVGYDAGSKGGEPTDSNVGHWGGDVEETGHYDSSSASDSDDESHSRVGYMTGKFDDPSKISTGKSKSWGLPSSWDDFKDSLNEEETDYTDAIENLNDNTDKSSGVSTARKRVRRGVESSTTPDAQNECVDISQWAQSWDTMVKASVSEGLESEGSCISPAQSEEIQNMILNMIGNAKGAACKDSSINVHQLARAMDLIVTAKKNTESTEQECTDLAQWLGILDMVSKDGGGVENPNA